MNDDISISPRDVSGMIADDAPTSYFLLDVRTAEEFATVAIEGAVNIPLDTIPDRLHDLPQDRKIITICHHGMRSKRAAQFLRDVGFADTWSLTGGVDVWAIDIDPTLPRY